MQHLQLRYVFDGSNNQDPWAPISSAWRSPANAWLVAHDLMHHRASDRGTLAEELATLGAEYFVCHEPLQESATPAETTTLAGQSELVGGAAGIVGMAWEQGGGKNHLSFYLPEPKEYPLTETQRTMFESAANSAIDQLRECLTGVDELDWASALKTFSDTRRVAAALAEGYFDAKTRFTSQAVARFVWRTVLQRVEAHTEQAYQGQVLEVSLRGNTPCVRLLEPLQQEKEHHA